jgi:hypothetical protein
MWYVLAAVRSINNISIAPNAGAMCYNVVEQTSEEREEFSWVKGNW